MGATQRSLLSDIFRPLSAKYITTVAMPTGAAPAASAPTVIQAVDLSVPIRGFRFVMKGRITVGTANYTSVNPESLLNLISNIQVTGFNRRQNGAVTPIYGDLASLFNFANLTQYRAGQIRVKNATVAVDTLARRPSIPYAISPGIGATSLVLLTTAASPYDYIVSLEIPCAPFGLNGFGQMGFLMRQEEWKDSISFKFTFPAVPDNAANPLGTSAATTVTTFSQYGAGGGNPTLDIYSLPVIMGAAKDSIIPGVLNRAIQPITTPVQTTGNNIELLRLQKYATSRLYIKTGVSASLPIFTSLSDLIVSAAGVQVGTDRNVRDLNDWEAHRMEMAEHYNVDPIQGCNAFDFIQSDNSDAAYPADKLGDGAIFRLVGNVTGGANQAALVLQEQILQKPEGALIGAS